METPIEQVININGSLKAWAYITVKNWHQNLQKKKIGQSGDLDDSFKEEVKGEEPNEVVTFLFNYYGKFVDMGVGKGVKMGDVKELSMSRRLLGRNSVTPRRAKKWYSKELSFQTYRLSKIMQEKYGRKAVGIIVEGLQQLNQAT
jgi:hypothetical protein